MVFMGSGIPGTDTGLLVEAELDTALYPIGKKVSDEELTRVQLTPNSFHGEWNYTVSPNH
jgi:DDE family transposase